MLPARPEHPAASGTTKAAERAGASPTGNLRVTAAHEFFHAVQFGYDVTEDSWLMESTATWVEDEIYDGVDDNRNFLASSALSSPERPLDTSGGSYRYGNWIWWRYLTERFPADDGTGLPVLVRDVWERARHTYSMDALDQALSADGRRLARLLADFGAANRKPDDSTTGIYEEGGDYRSAPLSATYALDASGAPDVAPRTLTLPHMSSTTVAFVPRTGYADGDWTLQVDVDAPSSTQDLYAAQLTVVAIDGSVVDRAYVPLSETGAGFLRRGFSSSSVRRVELTLTNGEHTYDCDRGTQWSCRGVLSPKRSFTFQAAVASAAP